jgi:hypothetical protein
LSDKGADFGLVGQAYEAPDLLQDAQRLINWYCEISGDKNSKTPIALLGTPGLNPILSTQTAAVRGAWVLPGGQTCIFVTGNTAYLATVTVPATQSSIAQFSVVSIGTLSTNNGPVCIRDNGVLFGGLGGYAVIVDGQFGYLYRMAGASTTTTTGTLVAGTPTVTFTAGINYQFIPGVVVSDGGVGIPGGTTIVSVNYNAGTFTMSANATTSPAGETITATLPAFMQIVDPAFLPASRVAFIEGWLIFNQVGTRTFFTNAPVPYTVGFAGSFYALKDSSTDNIVTLFENARELWLIGERTSELWYNSGGANFAFSRIPGVGPHIGCSATHSITRLGTSLMWLGKNEQGENIVVGTNQYTWDTISTIAINKAISSYPFVSDAIGYGYQEQGHGFYVLTFPTADVTWVFDGSTKMWHQRLSYDPNTGVYHRHRSNCFVNFADLRLVGDYTTGQIHQMDRAFYTDAGNPIRCQRRTPHVWSREDRKRVFQSSLQVEFTPGVGLQVGQGVNPQAMLRWSNDGGFTWSSEHWATIGAAGATKNRAMWRRLGRARDRVFELNYSDPTARDIVGATLFGEAENDEEAA